jgi:hypothetical protein
MLTSARVSDSWLPAGGAGPAIVRSGSAGAAIIGSGSLLARTAIELAERHPISRGIDGEPWCLNCWSPWPCGPAQHAREVCNAAGVDLPVRSAGPGSVGIGGRSRAAH